jgi:superfamily II DNA or RNA helicase
MGLIKTTFNLYLLIKAIGGRIYQLLQEHDINHPKTEHQAMIITQTKADCDKFVNIINKFFITAEISGHRNIAESYHGTDKKNVLDSFKAGEIRILLVCGKLIEGFDRKQVSVVGILRKIQPKSKAFFAQFVGRCVRRVDRDDNINAYVISHPYYNQKTNFDSMEEIAEFDPEDLEDN